MNFWPAVQIATVYSMVEIFHLQQMSSLQPSQKFRGNSSYNIPARPACGYTNRFAYTKSYASLNVIHGFVAKTNATPTDPARPIPARQFTRTFAPRVSTDFSHSTASAIRWRSIGLCAPSRIAILRYMTGVELCWSS